MNEPWKCYFLATSDGGSSKTYIGITPDLERRLKQHNGLQSGGAKATSGRTWERICHVKGFPDHTAALQFEWRWKQISRKYGMTYSPIGRRLHALQELLSLDKPTTAAVEYSSYETPLEVVIETARELPAL
uniref:GIY-YIG domain-containing protein n=1 Tax=viral metagenome TaxID=1070528 RepID=A0A6C0JUX3_9ZZZZ